MLVALNRKDYYGHMRQEFGDEFYGKKYKEACQGCVDACEKLFTHYSDSNKLKE